jgi:hypothetical protein
MRHSSPPLWDLPTRLFHWLIVCCLPLAWWSGETDNYAIHQWVGYTVIVLVVSRVAWGVLGSRHSRFTDFVVGPAKVLAYIRGQGAVGFLVVGCGGCTGRCPGPVVGAGASAATRVRGVVNESQPRHA